MALVRTGGLILKATKPIFANPIFVLPSSLNVQRRHAARKGYRDKLKKQKNLVKVSAAVTQAETKLMKKFSKITKTVDLKKPEPPNDDVIILDHFNHMKYSLEDIIGFHREYHHPTVFNNPSAPVSLKIEIRMIGKKETQFLKPFSGIAPIPHHFSLRGRRDVLVFCKPEDTDSVFKYGASMAGGADLVKKIKEGTVQPVLYDYVIAHASMIQELNPIRNLLKLQLPKIKNGTLTNDLKYAVDKFLHGVEYTCVKVGDSEDFGVIDVDIGTLEMETSQLRENFQAIIKDVELHRPKKEGKFITWIWCVSRPSPEQFSLDLSEYIDIETAETPAPEPEHGKSRKSIKAAAQEEEDDDDEDEEEGAAEAGEKQ